MYVHNVAPCFTIFQILFYVPRVSRRRPAFSLCTAVSSFQARFFSSFFPPIAIYPALFSLHFTQLSNLFVGIICKSLPHSSWFFFFFNSHPIFFHFTRPLLIPPHLVSFHISRSSSGWLPSSLSLLHTPDALLLAPVCPRGLIDSER